MKQLDKILKDYKSGKTSLAGTKKQVGNISLVKLAHTRVDLQRRERTGASEVIYGAGKTTKQILEIAETLLASNQNVLATRLSDEAIHALKEKYPKAKISDVAKMVAIYKGTQPKLKGQIAVVSAGTSDMRVAEEAKFTAEFFGNKVETFYDCGVAGLNRLANAIDQIKKAKVIIVVAGMEGALASVLAGLVKSPIIAVPTSVGYGANFGGLSALLSMINSCANGVSIVNIDNGFGAGYNAHLINSLK